MWPARDALGLHERLRERRLVAHLRWLGDLHHRVLHHLPDRLDLSEERSLHSHSGISLEMAGTFEIGFEVW